MLLAHIAEKIKERKERNPFLECQDTRSNAGKLSCYG